VTVTTTVLVTSDQADPDIATTDGEPKATSQEPALESVAEQKTLRRAAGGRHAARTGATRRHTAAHGRERAHGRRSGAHLRSAADVQLGALEGFWLQT
jgi:hypothetical protein